MPVETGLLESTFPDDINWDTFPANYTQYLQDTFAAINNADLLTLTSAKTVFHRFIDGISIEG